MGHYVGIDVSLELSSVCVVEGRGKVVKEAKVASEPEALVCFFKELAVPVNRIGLEAGPLSQWLHAGLTQAGFETVLLETRHVKAALSAMTVKTDRKDACGLGHLVRMGWFQQVHAKSMGSQEIRALLVARKQLLGRLLDVELSIRGILRGFGLKVGQATRNEFEARIRELVIGQVTLERIAGAMLSARAALKSEYEKLHKAVLAIVREDAVCRKLMTVPGVGPLVAVTFKSAVDDPSRIRKSKGVGALFGLTPKKYQSGEKDITGGITRAGDEMVRAALYEAANVLLSRVTRFSKLKRWGMDVAKRRGLKRAKVALARKIGVILHRMWVDGTTYRWTEAKPTVPAQGAAPFNSADTWHLQERWLTTARGRLGWTVWDKSLLYVTGGAAWAKLDTTETRTGSLGAIIQTDTRTGWTVGAGWEYALGYGWSARAEYLYVDFGDWTTLTGTLPGPSISNLNVNLRDHIFRGGMSYKFW